MGLLITFGVREPVLTEPWWDVYRRGPTPSKEFRVSTEAGQISCADQRIRVSG